MTNVTQRINQIKQPRGGYINPKWMEKVQLGGEGAQILDHKLENTYPAVVGMAVDALSRLANGSAPGDAFAVSLRGALAIHLPELVDSNLNMSRLVPFVDIDYLSSESAAHGMNHVTDALLHLDSLHSDVPPDDDAIRAAVHLVGYNVVAFLGPSGYEGKHVVPDEITIKHIRTMVERAVSFFARYGPVTANGFFPVNPRSMTELVNGGDGDFLTSDTLWDFKVSVSSPTSKNTLQLLVYLLMGQRSGRDEFEQLAQLGIFNPRLNIVYRMAVEDVPADVVRTVSVDVIGYPQV